MMKTLSYNNLVMTFFITFAVCAIPLGATAADNGEGTKHYSHVNQLGDVVRIKLLLTDPNDPNSAELLFLNAQLGALVVDPNVPDDQFIVFERPDSNVNGVTTELSCIKNSGIPYIPIGVIRATFPPNPEGTSGKILAPLYIFDREEDGGLFTMLRYVYDLNFISGPQPPGPPPFIPVGVDATFLNQIASMGKVRSIDTYILINGVAFNPAPQVLHDMVEVTREKLEDVCPDGLDITELGT